MSTTPPPPDGPTPPPPPPTTPPVEDPGPQPWAPTGEQPLAPRVVLLWRAGAGLPVGFLLLVTLGFAAGFGGWMWLAPAAAVLLGIVLVGVLPTLRYRRWRWRMTDRALELSHGVLFRQVRALPYFRIQHIDVEHGPLDRGLGLARLDVHTASVTATLPGLPADAAPRVRAALLERAGDAVARTDRGDDAV